MSIRTRKERHTDFAPARLKQEMGWSGRSGHKWPGVPLSYTASDPVSNLVLQADDMRRDGHIRAAEMLIGAAHEVARCQKIATFAVRNAQRVPFGRRARP